MKKLIRPILSVAVIATMVACGGAADKAKEMAGDATDAAAAKVEEVMEKTVAIKLDESNVEWSGSVLGMHSHQGTVKVTEGSLEMKGTDIVGGKFTIDMTSINPTDSNYSEDKTAEMLVGHLSSGDFFLVDSFPTATFVIKSADLDAKTITGDLTVRGTTKEETIQDVAVDVTSGSATGSLTIDRQAYNVAFSHPAKDIVLSDDIELTINLKM